MDTTSEGRLVSAPFALVTAATLAFFVYVGIMVPIIPRYIEQELGGGEVAIGLSVAVFAVAAVAARPVIGSVGDRRGRRVLMVGGALTASVAGGLSGFAPSIAVLLPLRALAGVGEAAIFVGAATLIADLSPPHRRAEAASYFSVAVFGGIGFGPIIGEAVLGDGHYVAAFLTAAAFAGLAAGLSLLAPDRVAAAAPSPVPAATAVPPSPSRRRFHPAALLTGSILALGVAGLAAFTAFMPLYTDELGLSGSSTVFLVYSVVCLVVRVLGARLPERLGLGRTAGLAFVFLAVGLTLVGATGTVAGLYLGSVVVGLGISLMYPSLMAMTVNGVSDSERTTVVATFTMFFEVGTALGGLALGAVAELGGPQWAFLGGAVSAAVGLAVLRFGLVPRRRAAAAVAAGRLELGVPVSVSAGE